MRSFRSGLATAITPGPVVSLAATSVLLALLHRSLGRTSFSADFLLLGLVRDFGPSEWLLLLVVGAACSSAVLKGHRGALVSLQGWSLAAGLLLTHYNLGSAAGGKIDPRFALAIIAGGASLQCCYLCLIAHAAMAFTRRRVPVNG